VTKRAVFLSVLVIGMSAGLGLAWVPEVPSFHNAWTLSAGMMLWATISALVTIALNTGAWAERFSRSAPKRPKRLPRWAWPLLIVILSVANILTTIAILAGNALFNAADHPSADRS
jgi:hypothetical protein